MVSGWLFENFDAGNFSPNTGESQDRETGSHFTVLADAKLTGLRWYRASADPDQAPVHLRVWDPDDFSIVYEADTIPDNGSIGWQAHAVVSDVDLVAHRRYMVTHGWQAHHEEAIFFLGTCPPGNYPVAFWLPQRVYSDGGINGLPNHLDSAYLTGVDAQATILTTPDAYEIVDETDYESTLKWGVVADKYRLNVTTIAQWSTAATVEGTDVRRIVGFWSPIDGDYVGKRFPVDAPQFDMELPGRGRMNGLLLDTSPGSAGHVQALIKV